MADAKQHDDFTSIAQEQFDEIYDGPDVDLANAVVDAVDLILNLPGQAQANSQAIRKEDGGIVLMYPKPGCDYRAYWATAGPRVEAIIEYPYP